MVELQQERNFDKIGTQGSVFRISPFRWRTAILFARDYEELRLWRHMTKPVACCSCEHTCGVCGFLWPAWEMKRKIEITGCLWRRVCVRDRLTEVQSSIHGSFELKLVCWNRPFMPNIYISKRDRQTYRISAIYCIAGAFDFRLWDPEIRAVP